MSSPDLRFAVILGLDPRISSQGIPKFRHYEGAKRPKQSHLKFRSKLQSNFVQGLINEIAPSFFQSLAMTNFREF
ncbi:MAG: hypothetical protein MR878_04000 [Campylobacter sp.]|nr:hypothetical protein [Campylobacter sp.]